MRGRSSDFRIIPHLRLPSVLPVACCRLVPGYSGGPVSDSHGIPSWPPAIAKKMREDGRHLAVFTIPERPTFVKWYVSTSALYFIWYACRWPECACRICAHPYSRGFVRDSWGIPAPQAGNFLPAVSGATGILPPFPDKHYRTSTAGHGDGFMAVRRPRSFLERRLFFC